MSAASRRPRREAAALVPPSTTPHLSSTHETISPARIKARDDGIRAERAAAQHLAAGGFAILEKNLRVGRYEIDLLVSDGPVVVVVEVRARGPRALVRALDTIDARKRARLRLAGKWLWRDRFAEDPRYERLRFDCVAVTFDESGVTRIEHVRAAF